MPSPRDVQSEECHASQVEYLGCTRAARYFYYAFSRNGLRILPSKTARWPNLRAAGAPRLVLPLKGPIAPPTNRLFHIFHYRC